VTVGVRMVGLGSSPKTSSGCFGVMSRLGVWDTMVEGEVGGFD